MNKEPTEVSGERRRREGNRQESIIASKDTSAGKAGHKLTNQFPQRRNKPPTPTSEGREEGRKELREGKNQNPRGKYRMFPRNQVLYDQHFKKNFYWGSPGGEHGNKLQYSCLENSMVRGAWWSTVHGVRESDMTLHSTA